MAGPPIFIHAGAHRTGTSSFQMCLHENREILGQAGWALAYPGRDGIPSGDLALRLPAGNTARAQKLIPKARKTLADHSADRPLILSEENIPGRMYHFMKGQFYPMAEMRCEALAAAWPGPVAHVMLVVRSYAEIFVSSYRKRAEENAMPTFDEVRGRYMTMDRGWPDLIAAMRDILRPEIFTVVPYTRRGTSADLLARLVPGLPGGALIEPKRVVNLSATDAALERLQTTYRAGDTLPRAQWKKIIRDNADDKTPRGVAAFSEDDKRVLSERYAADLMSIERMDGITFG